jgi:hypothetical protein
VIVNPELAFIKTDPSMNQLFNETANPKLPPSLQQAGANIQAGTIMPFHASVDRFPPPLRIDASSIQLLQQHQSPPSSVQAPMKIPQKEAIVKRLRKHHKVTSYENKFE